MSVPWKLQMSVPFHVQIRVRASLYPRRMCRVMLCVWQVARSVRYCLPSMCRAFHPCLRPRDVHTLLTVTEPLQTARHMRTFHMSRQEDLTRIISKRSCQDRQQHASSKNDCARTCFLCAAGCSQQPPAQETCCNDWLCGRRPHRSRRVGNRRYPRGNRTHEKVEVEQMAFPQCDVNTKDN